MSVTAENELGISRENLTALIRTIISTADLNKLTKRIVRTRVVESLGPKKPPNPAALRVAINEIVVSVLAEQAAAPSSDAALTDGPSGESPKAENQQKATETHDGKKDPPPSRKAKNRTRRVIDDDEDDEDDGYSEVESNSNDAPNEKTDKIKFVGSPKDEQETDNLNHDKSSLSNSRCQEKLSKDISPSKSQGLSSAKHRPENEGANQDDIEESSKISTKDTSEGKSEATLTEKNKLDEKDDDRDDDKDDKDDDDDDGGDDEDFEADSDELTVNPRKRAGGPPSRKLSVKRARISSSPPSRTNSAEDRSSDEYDEGGGPIGAKGSHKTGADVKRGVEEEPEPKFVPRKKTRKIKDAAKTKGPDEKKLERLNAVLRGLGVRLPPKIYKNTDSSSRVSAIIDFLHSKGVKNKDPWTMNKREIVRHRKRIEREKDLAGLDMSNIIDDGQRARRSRRAPLSVKKQEIELPSDVDEEDASPSEEQEYDGDEYDVGSDGSDHE